MSTTLIATASSGVIDVLTRSVITTLVDAGTVATTKLLVHGIAVVLDFFSSLIWLSSNHNKLKIISFLNLIWRFGQFIAYVFWRNAYSVFGPLKVFVFRFRLGIGREPNELNHHHCLFVVLLPWFMASTRIVGAFRKSILLSSVVLFGNFRWLGAFHRCCLGSKIALCLLEGWMES